MEFLCASLGTVTTETKRSGFHCPNDVPVATQPDAYSSLKVE
jgi:hypothetical protein